MTGTRRFAGVAGALVTLVLASIWPASDAQAGLSRRLPKRFRRSPYTLMSLSIGHPNHGWQLRAKKLRETDHLRVKASARNECYGHPALVLMLKRSARDVERAVDGSVMVVGDLSTQRGGPLAGHASHQSGRDADVGFYVRNADGEPVIPKRFKSFGGDGRAKDGSGWIFDDHRNWLLVQSWVRDERAGLSHIFVSRALRRRLLDFARERRGFRKYVPQAARLLKQPASSSRHDNHFHVRISCPKRQEGICHEHPR